MTDEQKTAYIAAFIELSTAVERLRPLYEELTAGTASTAAPLDLSGWPAAVPPTMIVRPEDNAARQLRASQMVGLLSKWLAGKSFLDFGCGVGDVAAQAAALALQVVGYDARPHAEWEQLQRGRDNLFLLTEQPRLQDLAPFHLILLYDVLDHVTDRADQVAILKLVDSLAAPNAIIFVRLHPWTARHGAHQYEIGHNLAYWHLSLTDAELADVGLSKGAGVVRPLAAYEALFRQVPWRQIDRRIDALEPEPFFSGPVLQRIIERTWQGAVDEETARRIMANQHIDFVLQKGA